MLCAFVDGYTWDYYVSVGRLLGTVQSNDRHAYGIMYSNWQVNSNV
jgi:hypothetical protein